VEHPHPDTDPLASDPPNPEAAEPSNGRPRLSKALAVAALVFADVALAAVVAAVAVNQWMPVESLAWRGGTIAVAMLAWAIACVCWLGSINTRPKATRGDSTPAVDMDEFAKFVGERAEAAPRRPSPHRRRAQRELVTVGTASDKEVSEQ
jgi:hypothetical protein